MSSSFQFHGFEIPERLAILTGGGGAVFEKVAEAQIMLLHRYVGLEPHFALLEIGCGVGKAAIPLASFISETGSYTGIDVIKDSIEWCASNVSSKHPNFKFVWLNVGSHMYNPDGTVHGSGVKFPIEDQTIDRIFLWSVFTHMLEADVANYLKEFRRVLKKDGRVLATWFLIEDGVLQSVRQNPSPLGDLTFQHQISDGCYVNVRDEPLGAVAYTRTKVEEIVKESGLMTEKLIHGYWCNFWGWSDTGQDITVLRVSD